MIFKVLKSTTPLTPTITLKSTTPLTPTIPLKLTTLLTPTIPLTSTSSALAGEMATNNLQSSAYPALADFQRDLHIRANLQSLPSFTGNPLSRFDTWLESFESIVSRSDLSEDDVILELKGKLIDKAHKVIKCIVANHPNDYELIRIKLIDLFHGDKTVEKYLKKFKKKLTENQAKKFMILQLDYKKFLNREEYEEVENTREKYEFVNAIVTYKVKECIATTAF
jgi:hypothetical protein